MPHRFRPYTCSNYFSWRQLPSQQSFPQSGDRPHCLLRGITAQRQGTAGFWPPPNEGSRGFNVTPKRTVRTGNFPPFGCIFCVATCFPSPFKQEGEVEGGGGWRGGGERIPGTAHFTGKRRSPPDFADYAGSSKHPVVPLLLLLVALQQMRCNHGRLPKHSTAIKHSWKR